MIETVFHQVFDTAPTQIVTAPGRVNLIGEHTDYNGGMVLPTAIDLSLTLAFRPRTDDIVRVGAGRFGEIVETNTKSPLEKGWAAYAVAALAAAREANMMDHGAEIYVTSSIPDGAGLSSSAALVVSILKAVNLHSNAKKTDCEIALLARRVENDYIGVPCGVMDQMAVALAHPGQAMALNTKTLDYELIDLPTDYHMAVVHSGQHRRLSESRYAERKSECDAAREALGVTDLCLVSDAELKRAETLPDPLRRRARHCATEHRRTVNAAAALRAGDITAFGALMSESHISMRDDFEMSLPAIDVLVKSAAQFGADGARLTGGGFGGCIVACVKKEHLTPWREKLLAAHPGASFLC